MPIYETCCLVCGDEHDAVVDKPAYKVAPAKTVNAYCERCDSDTIHERYISLCVPAKYLGEKEHNPRVLGGQFDTAGKQRLPALPSVESTMQYDPHVGKPVETHTLDAIQTAWGTKEAKEIKEERVEIKKRNKMKQLRDTAIGAGQTINFGKNKSDRLPGDPSFKNI